VRERRQELGLTQEQVVLRAQQAGEDISANGLRFIEQGKSQRPQERTRKALAAGLDVPVEEINRWVGGTTNNDQHRGRFRDWAARTLRPDQREPFIRELQRMIDDVDDLEPGPSPEDELREIMSARALTDAEIDRVIEVVRQITRPPEEGSG
jgi:transcriptional regulator with XRE-family HTH domain